VFQYNLKRRPFYGPYRLLVTESEPKTQSHQFAAMKPIVCRKINGTQDREDQKKATKEELSK
jgi:hypothetical protein